MIWFFKLLFSASEWNDIPESNERDNAKKWPFKRLFSTSVITIIILLSFYCCSFFGRCCMFTCAGIQSFLVKHGLLPKKIKVIRLFRGGRKHKNKNMSNSPVIAITTIAKSSMQLTSQLKSKNASQILNNKY